MAGGCIAVADNKAPVQEMEPRSEAAGRIGNAAHKVVDALQVAHRIGLEVGRHRRMIAGVPFCRFCTFGRKG